MWIIISIAIFGALGVIILSIALTQLSGDDDIRHRKCEVCGGEMICISNMPDGKYRYYCKKCNKYYVHSD